MDIDKLWHPRGINGESGGVIQGVHNMNVDAQERYVREAEKMLEWKREREKREDREDQPKTVV